MAPRILNMMSLVLAHIDLIINKIAVPINVSQVIEIDIIGVGVKIGTKIIFVISRVALNRLHWCGMYFSHYVLDILQNGFPLFIR